MSSNRTTWRRARDVVSTAWPAAMSRVPNSSPTVRVVAEALKKFPTNATLMAVPSIPGWEVQHPIDQETRHTCGCLRILQLATSHSVEQGRDEHHRRLLPAMYKECRNTGRVVTGLLDAWEARTSVRWQQPPPRARGEAGRL